MGCVLGEREWWMKEIESKIRKKGRSREERERERREG